jgi:PhnB protein
MAKAKKPIPEGARTITPHLIVNGAAQAIEFYKKAFGARENGRFAGPDGKIMHASLTIGDSQIYLNDEIHGGPAKLVAPPSLGGNSVGVHLYVEDCDRVYNQAVGAGAKATMPLQDQFWGDRYGMVTDPFGHVWSIATHKEDLTAAEMEERGRQFMSSTSRH